MENNAVFLMIKNNLTVAEFIITLNDININGQQTTDSSQQSAFGCQQ